MKGINYLESTKLWKLRISEDKTTVISNERLASDEPHFFEYGAASREEILQHLKKLFPSAKIILARREFNRWLKSCYRQYIVCGGVLDFDSYCKKYSYNFIDMDYYEDCIRNMFDDVLVFSQEELLQNTKETVQKICDFIGVEVPTYSNKKQNVTNKGMLEIRRKVNKYYKSEFNPKAPFLTDLIISSVLFQMERRNKE